MTGLVSAKVLLDELEGILGPFDDAVNAESESFDSLHAAGVGICVRAAVGQTVINVVRISIAMREGQPESAVGDVDAIRFCGESWRVIRCILG